VINFLSVVSFLKTQKLFLIGLASSFLIYSCTNSSSTQTALLQSNHNSEQTDGNGKTYDGKIRIVHHYDANQKIYCHGQEVPYSILYRKSDTNDSWYLITNKSDCQQDPAIHVDGVNYDDSLKVAQFQGKNYYPPKIIEVVASEDPNLPDTNLFDGICLDSRGFCSLRAAVEQASSLSSTSDVRINVSTGVYKITEPLAFHFPSTIDGHQIYLNGQDKMNTVIDGNGTTSHIKVDGSSGGLNISNFGFKNGYSKVAFSSSSILPYYFHAPLNIENCLFENNVGASTLYAGLGNLEVNIRQSTFQNNQTATNDGVISTFSTPLLIENSTITQNIGIGVLVENKTSNVVIKNSTISYNQSLGLSFYQCVGCEVENSTIAYNKYGIYISTAYFGNSANLLDVLINNTTIAYNGDSEFANLTLALTSSETKIRLSNSILANGHSTTPNCTPGGSLQALVAINSLIDDNSCSLDTTTSANNLIAVDPLLGALSDNGGYTPTMKPSAISPVIDQGLALTCSVFDQRGQVRLGASCDIGAIEVK